MFSKQQFIINETKSNCILILLCSILFKIDAIKPNVYSFTLNVCRIIIYEIMSVFDVKSIEDTVGACSVSECI